MVDEELAPEGLQRILAGLGSHLEDPKVVSAVLLSYVAYTRAQDVNSILHRWIAFVRSQSGLPSIDAGVSNFQKAIAFVGAGVTGFAIAEATDRLLIELEIRRLKQEYKDALAIYNVNRPAWESKDTLPEPVQPPIISFEEFTGPTADLGWSEYRQFELDYVKYVKQQEKARAIYRNQHRRWLNIQNMDEPIHPIPDPAIALWNKEGEVTPEDAATFALIAFIIGLNPSIVPEALKGVGEIVKGIGEIVPL